MRTFAVLLIATTCFGQAGDRKGETQRPLPEDLEVPPAPVLNVDASLNAFTVEPGFRVDAVAFEPLIEDPVAMEIDERGRFWVVEMRGYMPNIDGTEELEPVGRVSILEDTDGDGVMDRSTVFVDDLVLPRAISLTSNGALIVEPPHLLHCQDLDGDGTADTKEILYTGFKGLDSPEHAGNGLMRSIDNWIYCSQHPLRFRFDGFTLLEQATPGHGQWGLTMDDEGRNYVSYNSSPLHVDLYPQHYASRHGSLPRPSGLSHSVANDKRVWPGRMTPGVNRGYQNNFLDDEFRLKTFTGACGQVILRSDALGAEVEGDAFICEPAGNLVKRYALEGDHRVPSYVQPYEGRDFLVSTDERFRPVNAYVGPDGSLYVLDMYRGIIQHRIFMTTFLRTQVEARGLDKPIGMGRIYRVSADDASAMSSPDLGSMSNEMLVASLSDPVGWVRDTAQRLLVERYATDVVDLLVTTANEAPESRTRLHALWTLEGVHSISLPVIMSASHDEAPEVRAASIRLMEPWVGQQRVLDRLDAMLDDDDRFVRIQAALTLGETRDPIARSLLAEAAITHASDTIMRGAVLSGIEGDERSLLRRLDGATSSNGTRALASDLSNLLIRSNDLSGLMAGAASAKSDWLATECLKRVAAHLRLDSDRPRNVHLDVEPEGWAGLEARKDEIGTRASAIGTHVDWPGRTTKVAVVQPLTKEQQASFERGRGLYMAICATCHQPDGMGQPGVNPPLVGTDWVLENDRRLIRLMMLGMSGRLELDGKVYNAQMPGAPWANDQQVADILNFIRRSWGNDGTPVEASTVTIERARIGGRTTPWSVEELESIPD